MRSVLFGVGLAGIGGVFGRMWENVRMRGMLLSRENDVWVVGN